MKNNTSYSLTKIISAVNNQFAILTEEEVELCISNESVLYIKLGSLTYPINHETLSSYLKKNNYDQNSEDENEVISKYLVNKLMTLVNEMSYAHSQKN
ncbi:hypothetical protein PGH12_06960 [Chryseobacterium wangxinyae]|uniref:hypothetical protein n=1 Tax=Chryseobacterium sp. CY350 TaxID=2997336 RepID=UPI00226D4558|nr:hypothetical protein [Chryseobacterium sp. CY350]MCY0976891.1 hypothetical protein [Chryseobacterium sp. CY350]WBZ96890.1 hypothetical protein PGH12_06960 [Chryseobacterium sp. CY350]